MRPLRYSINVTMDGCCDHRAVIPARATHQFACDSLEQADALIMGRVMYELMESGWRHPVPPGTRPEWMEPFARTIGAMKKYVVSSTLSPTGWNAELLRGDVGHEVRRLKGEPGRELLVAGVTLPKALAALGLIDVYEFLIHPRIAGHGPILLAGLPAHLDLRLVDERPYGEGMIAVRYAPASAS